MASVKVVTLASDEYMGSLISQPAFRRLIKVGGAA
jgi:hypothetical protein